MDRYSSRSHKLWKFAAQLFEEEAKSIPFAQQEEEHGPIIRTKYNQLVSNLSCVGDIIAAMYQEKKLEPKELEQIQHLQSTPIRANEELLSIIARKPRDVFECFLSLIKSTNQPHIYQMLVSGDDTCDKATRENVLDHSDLICRNFMWLSEKLDTENGLISVLYQRNVLTVREREDIFCTDNAFRKSEILLGLISKKSPKDFEKFLEALEYSGQGHLAKQLKEPKGSTADPKTDAPADSKPTRIHHKLLPKELKKSGEKPVPVRYTSKPAPPPKPGTQKTIDQHYAKSMHTVAKTTELTVNFRRAEGVKFQAKLKGLESRLQTDVAIKVTSVFLHYSDKPGYRLKMCFHILLQECYHMRKEIFLKIDETNVEMEQLRKDATQYSTAAALNDVFRMQLHSMRQELTSERFERASERMQLEKTETKLRTEIHNEKSKCNQLEEEKLLNNTFIMDMTESLNKAECDKQFSQKQIHELHNRLASTQYELQKSKECFEERNSEVISLRGESEKLKEACEILRKEKETRNDLEVQSLHTEEYNQELETQLKEKERSLELAQEEMLNMIKYRKRDTVEEKPLENDQILKMLEELESEKHRRQWLEDKLSNATSELEKLEGRSITFVTKESHVIRSNHQFLVENITSSPIIYLLYEKNYITEAEKAHLLNQPIGDYTNDALLQWMRTIPLKQDKGQKVLECFRQAKQNFIADLLEKGGVLIKSKISTKLVKERLFVKSSSKNVEELREKEATIIKKLNLSQGVFLYSNTNVPLEILGDDIVIAPYCHQEADGIVIWFWCQSQTGQNNLDMMYESGILLEKLVTIFRQVSNDSMSSASKVLVPTSITIFVGIFNKDDELHDNRVVLSPYNDVYTEFAF